MYHSLEDKISHGTPQFPFASYSAHTMTDNFVVAYHWHKHLEIIYIEDGETTFLIDGRTYVGTAGDIFFINPMQAHQLMIEKKGGGYFSFVFLMDWLDFSEKDSVQSSVLNPLKKNFGFSSHITPDMPGYSELKNILETIRSKYVQKELNYIFKIKIALYEMLLIMDEYHMIIPFEYQDLTSGSLICIRIRELTDYITTHFAEHISLEDAASIMHMTPKYFSSFFSKTFLVTFVQYINLYRINQACILLKTTNHAITDIALEVGFDNISYFIRKFKEIEGCTPNVYRKIL